MNEIDCSHTSEHLLKRTHGRTHTHTQAVVEEFPALCSSIITNAYEVLRAAQRSFHMEMCLMSPGALTCLGPSTAALSPQLPPPSLQGPILHPAIIDFFTLSAPEMRSTTVLHQEKPSINSNDTDNAPVVCLC